MADNIVKLATLQDTGELPPGTEDALALIYAERHTADSRYVAAWSRWLLYDGARWIFDTTLHAFDRARVIWGTNVRISLLNSGRSVADLPDRFSLNIRLQPAALSAST